MKEDTNQERANQQSVTHTLSCGSYLHLLRCKTVRFHFMDALPYKMRSMRPFAAVPNTAKPPHHHLPHLPYGIL